MWLSHLHESDFSVELVCISGAENEEPYATNLGMFNRCLNEKRSDTLTVGCLIDEDVAEPPKGGPVGHPPGEGDLPT